MKNIFAEFKKFDDEQRIVEGYATTEALDAHGETVSKEAIVNALNDYLKFGNIREMHQPSAVGTIVSAEMDDFGLKIAIKVVDDVAWKKVKEGVYKGFSIGGKILKKIGNKIVELLMNEISLVDRPACPEALITLWKLDGDKQVKITKTETNKALQTIAAVNLRKACGMAGVADLAYTLNTLNWVVSDAEWEKEFEGDNSTVPAQLREGYRILSEALQTMCAEEASEDIKNQLEQAGEVVVEEVITKSDDTKEEEKETDDEDADDDDKEEEAEEKNEEDNVEKSKKMAKSAVSDEQKAALKVIYQMMVDLDLVEEVKAGIDEAQKETAEEVVGDAEKNDIKEDEKTDVVAEEESEVVDEKLKEAEEKAEEKEEEVVDKSSDEENKDTEKTDEENDVKKSVTKNNDLFKSAGYKNQKQALDEITRLNKELNDLKKAVASLPALTKGNLLIVGRDGKTEELSAASLIEKGEKPQDVLAKMLSGEISSGMHQRFSY